jgi:hypothetical protein
LVVEISLQEAAFMASNKQITVFLENKPGRLANVLSALAREKVNLNALTVMASHETGVLRFITDDLAKARTVLKSVGAPHSETDVVLLELRNQPGAMAHVCETLAGQHINVEYAYSGPGGRNGKSIGIFKVSNTEKAARVLAESPNNLTRRRMGRRPIRTMPKTTITNNQR